jgi:hypothetical protein
MNFSPKRGRSRLHISRRYLESMCFAFDWDRLSLLSAVVPTLLLKASQVCCERGGQYTRNPRAWSWVLSHHIINHSQPGSFPLGAMCIHPSCLSLAFRTGENRSLSQGAVTKPQRHLIQPPPRTSLKSRFTPRSGRGPEIHKSDKL